MADFRPLNEHELARLSDEDLLAYIRSARTAGESASAILAVRILVYGHIANVDRRVRLRVPVGAVDEVTGDALVSAIASAVKFEGEEVGQFVAWLNRIVDRRVADFHRKKRLDLATLAEEHEGDEEIWGEIPSEADPTGVVEVQMIIERILDGLRKDHKRVVDLYVFGRWEAQETGQMVGVEFPELDPPMSVDNVHQIAKRFRNDLRKELDGRSDDDEDR